jgi:hypothetical protein
VDEEPVGLPRVLAEAGGDGLALARLEPPAPGGVVEKAPEEGRALGVEQEVVARVGDSSRRVAFVLYCYRQFAGSGQRVVLRQELGLGRPRPSPSPSALSTLTLFTRL